MRVRRGLHHATEGQAVLRLLADGSDALHVEPTPDSRVRKKRDNSYFADMVAYVDKLITHLDTLGLRENTLVVFTGDNGGAQFRGKGTLYEFDIHCPLIIRWLGVVKPGMASAELISGEDLVPTLLAAGGVDAPKEMTGRSFLPLLKGEGYKPREQVFAQRGAHGSGLPANSAAFDLGRCVVSKKYKLIYNALRQIPYHPVEFAGDEMWRELVQMNKNG